MRLATITIRDANWHPVPGATVSSPTGKTVSDINGRAIIVMHPGDTVVVEHAGFRRTTSVVSESIADVVLLPEKLKIVGVPDKRDRKAWLLLPLAAGLAAMWLRGANEHRAIELAKERNQRRTGSMAVGEKELGQWQQEMADDLAALYTHLAVLASPDTEAALKVAEGKPPSRGVSLPPSWHFSMDRLYDFAADLKSGKTTNMMARSEMYADSGHGLFEKVAAETLPEVPGFVYQEKSNLRPAEHCKDCLRMARKGWSPKGSLIPIGRRKCGVSCKCFMSYRRIAVRHVA